VPLYAILSALRRVALRDLGTFQSIKVNNFFLFVALLIWGALVSGVEPKSAEPLLLLLGFIMMFPLSSDPLARIPPQRLALWPLSHGQALALRLSSLAFSPLVWITVFLIIRTASATVAVAFVSLAAAIQIAGAWSRRAAQHSPHWNLLRYVPPVPGRLGGLIRKDARELLSVLDPYIALLLSAGGLAYRFLGDHPDPHALPILSVLVALALSTYGQSLFALDADYGMMRYRLLPLHGWEILLAKGIAFLAVLFVLVLPLSPGPGITFGLWALAVGHYSSLNLQLPQHRWRFVGGRMLPVGLLQAVGGVALGFAERDAGPLVLLATALAYAASVFWFGRTWRLD